MQKKSKKLSTGIAAIIPAAGKPSNGIVQHSILPDAMVPINGKPVIGYILEDLLSRNILEVSIALHPADSYTQKYIEQKFSDKFVFHFVRTPSNRGVGNSIYKAAQKLRNRDGALVYLGDTIYKGSLDFKHSFLVTSKKYENPQQWCFAEKLKSGKFIFTNKPQQYKGDGSVLCGLYFFKNSNSLLNAAGRAMKAVKKVEVSDILEFYQKSDKFISVPARRWYDCGNIENYYAAKVDFLRVRSFNTLTYNPTLGVITKSGSNVQKINQEINWYLNAPDELKMFAPRLYDYKIGKNRSEYSVEYYGYQTLADIHMFAYINSSIWQSIINRLFEIISLFKKHRTKLPFSYFSDMYIKKLRVRLEDLSKEPYWKKILARETVTINGVVYKNISFFESKLEKMAERLYRQSDMSFTHGDLCLSNILYDVDSRLIKLVDPRGYFGKMSIYGDIKYDLAKLRHSFSGHFDFIMADLFKVEEPAEGQFYCSVYTEDYHEQIAKKFDAALQKQGYILAEIKYIEALLFLSMLPLHSNSLSRQKALYLRGIQLINQILI